MLQVPPTYMEPGSSRLYHEYRMGTKAARFGNGKVVPLRFDFSWALHSEDTVQLWQAYIYYHSVTLYELAR